MINQKNLDLKRSKETNQMIIQSFEYLINTPNIKLFLAFYRRQNYLLYIEECDGLLRFYGHKDYVEHNNSNIEYIIKFICHKLLYDNGKGEILINNGDLTLAWFGFIRMHYINAFGKTATDIELCKIILCKRQIEILKGILRMIKERETNIKILKFENQFNDHGEKVNNFRNLSFPNMKAYVNFRNLEYFKNNSYCWWENRDLFQWFHAEKVLI